MSSAPAVNSRTGLAYCFADLGNFDEGITVAEEAIRLAEAVNNPFGIIMAHCWGAHPYLVKGDLSKAIPLLERAVEVCREQVPVNFPRAASFLGYAYLHSGRAAEALDLLNKAVDLGVKTSRWGEQSLRVAYLGEGYLLLGRIDDAIESAESALDLARRHNERGNEVYVLRLLGEIAAHKDPLDIGKAENHYRQALALAEELGMRPLVAHCHVGLGKVYGRSGDLHKAKEHLTTATTMMREMEMGLWLENAEAELKELS